MSGALLCCFGKSRKQHFDENPIIRPPEDDHFVYSTTDESPKPLTPTDYIPSNKHKHLQTHAKSTPNKYVRTEKVPKEQDVAMVPVHTGGMNATSTCQSRDDHSAEEAPAYVNHDSIAQDANSSASSNGSYRKVDSMDTCSSAAKEKKSQKMEKPRNADEETSDLYVNFEQFKHSMENMSCSRASTNTASRSSNRSSNESKRSTNTSELAEGECSNRASTNTSTSIGSAGSLTIPKELSPQPSSPVPTSLEGVEIDTNSINSVRRSDPAVYENIGSFQRNHGAENIQEEEEVEYMNAHVQEETREHETSREAYTYANHVQIARTNFPHTHSRTRPVVAVKPNLRNK